ncbi:hypothetical protein MRX96_036469 [Rhipicephalus microplus]
MSGDKRRWFKQFSPHGGEKKPQRQRSTSRLSKEKNICTNNPSRSGFPWRKGDGAKKIRLTASLQASRNKAIGLNAEVDLDSIHSMHPKLFKIVDDN